MQKNLYFVCPTDCLETIINNKFRQENYFYTSLGNSVNVNFETLQQIQTVVQKHCIRKICFVLSSDNKIIYDALHQQFFSKTKGLQSLYTEILKQKKQSVFFLKNDKEQFAILSYLLNMKIQEIRTKWATFFNDSIEICAKIYDRDNNCFKPSYSNLMYLKKHQLN